MTRRPVIILVVLGIAFSLVPQVEGAEVDTFTTMAFRAKGAGIAWVRSDHVVRLKQYSATEGQFSALALNSRFYFNSGVWDEETLLEDVSLNGSTGQLYHQHLRPGACALIDGVYEAVTRGGSAPLGVPILAQWTSVENGGIVFLNCPPTDPCFPEALRTSTVRLALGTAPTKNFRRTKVLGVPNILETIGGSGTERYVSEEWALQDEDGRWTSSSDELLQELEESEGRGFALYVQSPVHMMNHRHIDLPRLKLFDSNVPLRRQLASDLRVLARVVFSEDELVDSVEFLYPKQGTGQDDWLRAFLTSRLGLTFASDKRHPTHAYVLVEVDDSVSIVDSIVVLPQCCCDTDFCL